MYHNGNHINVVMLENAGGVPGSVCRNRDDSYTIFIDAGLSFEKQKKVFKHELQHIEKNDFAKINIQTIESEAHREPTTKNTLWDYNNSIGLQGIISAYKANCHTLNEIAEHLEVSEEFLAEALECYRKKYGVCTKVDNYVIYLEPHLGVMEMI